MQRLMMGDYTFPATNRVLVEWNGLYYTSQSNRSPWEDSIPGIVPVQEQSTGMQFKAANSFRFLYQDVYTVRGALSYITAAHAFKVGVANKRGGSHLDDYDRSPVSYRLNRGVPNRITQRALGEWKATVDFDLGAYVQDRWTLGNLTMNYGVRYDYFHNSYPEQHIGPEILAPARNITFPAMDGWSLHDLSPRFGAMYDVGGQGTTALKVSLNRYVLAMGPDVSFIQLANPSRNLVTQSTRSWGDADRDHVPDCDLVNPLRNGECGPLSNRNFGTVVSTVSYDEDGLTGWGHRSFNWEFPAGVEGDRLNVTTGRDNALTGLQQQRVNQVSDDMDGGQSLNRYLNPAAFAQPAPGTLGNFERNSLVGPSFWSVNVAVAKLVPTTTVQTLELRLEAFNLFNTFNWGNPTNFNSGNFGRILSQAGDPRVLQFGVKYGF